MGCNLFPKDRTRLRASLKMVAYYHHDALSNFSSRNQTFLASPSLE